MKKNKQNYLGTLGKTNIPVYEAKPKCKHCGSKHHYTDIKGNIKDICFNCEVVENFLNNVMLPAINGFTPSMGGKRKLEIISYKISKC